MYRIFKNECVIFLTDNFDLKEKSNFFQWKHFNLKAYLLECDDTISTSVYLYHPDREELLKEFKHNFNLIKAAGGLVFNAANEILFIFRNGKWDLPKGKVEKNEDIKQAAIREVQEECGINKIKIEDFIMCTYHIYPDKDKEILKETYWYKMHSFEDNDSLKPQIEEGITQAVFKDKNKAIQALQNTYSNLKILIQKYID